MFKFLETINAEGDDILVPINKINLIKTSEDDQFFKIHIFSRGNEYVELFLLPDRDCFRQRYEIIKEIVGAQ